MHVDECEKKSRLSLGVEIMWKITLSPSLSRLQVHPSAVLSPDIYPVFRCGNNRQVNGLHFIDQHIFQVN